MSLTRNEIECLWKKWNDAWDKHDLDAVMTFFHDDVYFSNWTGGYAKGKKQLKKAWQGWFKHHGNFVFDQKEIFIDEQEQKLLYRWKLTWPSFEKGFEGKEEKREGVDVIHFKGGKIYRKLTFSKTTIEISGQRVELEPR